MSGRSSERQRGPKSKRAAQVYPFNDLEGTQWLQGLVIGAAIIGYAIRIGLTRDGGALSIGVYAGEEYGNEYVAPDENLSEAVREIALGWKIPIATWDDVAGMWIVPQAR